MKNQRVPVVGRHPNSHVYKLFAGWIPHRASNGPLRTLSISASNVDLATKKAGFQMRVHVGSSKLTITA